MHRARSVAWGLSLVFSMLFATGPLAAGEYYVSANRGKGKKGTKEKPVKDLGSLIKKLKAGDTIHIAQGRYLGRQKSGHDKIEVPVKIIGGWNDDFTRRDPWGEFPTVLTGDNKHKNFKSNARLAIICNRFRKDGDFDIVVDGIIVDNGDRNQYTDENNAKIKRMFSPKTGANASPDTPGIYIWPHSFAKVTIQNCIVMNCAPNTKQGAIQIKGSQGNKNTIRNNLAINNTGCGIACLTAWNPRDGRDRPEFLVENNTVLFTWKYDAMSSHSGRGLQVERVPVVARENVFGFSDFYGVHNGNGADWQNITLIDNVFSGNLVADYYEWNAVIPLEDIEDEAEKLGDDTEGNEAVSITVPVSPEWSKDYAARVVIDRNQAEESIQPKDTWANDVHRMLGLPLDGGTLDVKSDIWLRRLSLEDALKVANTPFQEKFGCKKPEIK